MVRGQVHTLEAITASLLLVTSVLVALQLTSVGPLSASTSTQYLETQQQGTAEGVLASAVERGALRRAVLFWHSSEESFHDTGEKSYYRSKAPPNDFGDLLDRAFGSKGIAYNVAISYQTAADERDTQRMVYQGVPGDNAATATRTVVLTDDAHLYDDTGSRTGTQVSGSNFYAGDTASSSVYTVLRVEVTVWRV